jgi:ureidoglycolate hydrolase
MSRPLRTITRESFEPYGTIIERDSAGPTGFQVILSETEAVGWRIAVNEITNRTVEKFARHPGSRESFEPLAGVALLYLAVDDPEQAEVFLLDRPVCLHKNVWHATSCLSESATVKITENLRVDSEEHPLARPIGPLVA